VCQYANSALETLISKQRHQDKCSQCRTDPAWCETASTYDREFVRDFGLWNHTRASGGVVIGSNRG